MEVSTALGMIKPLLLTAYTLEPAGEFREALETILNRGMPGWAQ